MSDTKKAVVELPVDPKAALKKVQKVPLVKEFEDFIARGNVVDLAVGVIIGGAFGKIVTSLVDDILMPIIGVLLNGVDFSGLSLDFKNAQIHYGMFIQNVVDFLIVAGCVFLMVKAINKLIKKQDDAKKDQPASPTLEEQQLKLLQEIRDQLAKR